MISSKLKINLPLKDNSATSPDMGAVFEITLLFTYRCTNIFDGQKNYTYTHTVFLKFSKLLFLKSENSRRNWACYLKVAHGKHIISLEFCILSSKTHIQFCIPLHNMPIYFICHSGMKYVETQP